MASLSSNPKLKSEAPSDTPSADNPGTSSEIDSTSTEPLLLSPTSPDDLNAPASPPIEDSPLSPSTTAAVPSRGVDQKPGHGAPGSAWNNKKFQDEYHRVMSGLLDNNSDSHIRYGDPLDPTYGN